MLIEENIFEAYENRQLVDYRTDSEKLRTVKFSELGSFENDGVLKMCRYEHGELVQSYTEEGSHVGVIAATRLGKTTSYVIPTVISFALQKRKKSMIISDPKGEIYRYTAELLKKQGYHVRLLNFRNYQHSECWNMLTPIYRKYRAINHVYDEVEAVLVDGVPKSRLRGKIYEDQHELDVKLERMTHILLEDVGNDIDHLATMFIATKNTKDPYWEDSARELLKAFIWAMLEDSDKKDAKFPITEDTFSFSSILQVISTFQDDDSTRYEDGGYFTDRPNTSKAYRLAKNTLLENGKPTRRCILAVLMTNLGVFMESAMRLITSCNTFEMSELAEGPVAIFLDYRDELKAHYQVISLFVQDAYRYLIERANALPNGRLETPFYFVLDEFGNFPCIIDFETTISACAGRNIFFILILQSYAQLNRVYESDVATIIRDNLNVHVFFGSNNPATLEEFSNECGEYTRVSPESALNGAGAEMDQIKLETIKLITKSRLSHFDPGECIVTEANCEYVMFSRMERYYDCKEFTGYPLSRELEYECPVDLFDKRYVYDYKPKGERD